jgi:predicted nucleic acid-binding protein
VTVFIDTSALLALLDSSDDNHDRALRGREAILGRRWVTHSYVVAESLALVRRRLGGGATGRFIDEVLPAIDVDDVDRILREATIRSYRQALAASVSYVDHVSFTFMRDHEITQAWAIDQDFVTAGFQLVA